MSRTQQLTAQLDHVTRMMGRVKTLGSAVVWVVSDKYSGVVFFVTYNGPIKLESLLLLSLSSMM